MRDNRLDGYVNPQPQPKAETRQNPPPPYHMALKAADMEGEPAINPYVIPMV